MRIKNMTYRVVWDDDGDRREETFRCDETKATSGERQFLRDGRVTFSIGTDNLISCRLKETRFHSPRSLSEFIEVLKLRYRYNHGSTLLPRR
jgi:hypothetical protein